MSDGVRVYFSCAPSYEWSPEVMHLYDLTLERLMSIFEHHLQSNKDEILKKGWETDIGIFVFDNDKDFTQRKNKKRKR